MNQLLIAIDQTINAALLGWADETLSSRCYRLSRDGKRQWPRVIIDRIFFWQLEHCKQSYESERKRLHLPPEFR